MGQGEGTDLERDVGLDSLGGKIGWWKGQPPPETKKIPSSFWKGLWFLSLTFSQLHIPPIPPITVFPLSLTTKFCYNQLTPVPLPEILAWLGILI